jgi:hypothetical protein
MVVPKMLPTPLCAWKSTLHRAAHANFWNTLGRTKASVSQVDNLKDSTQSKTSSSEFKEKKRRRVRSVRTVPVLGLHPDQVTDNSLQLKKSNILPSFGSSGDAWSTTSEQQVFSSRFEHSENWTTISADTFKHVGKRDVHCTYLFSLNQIGM